MKKMMKVMAMVLFVVSMSALTSCTKDNSDLILGKWKFDKAVASFGSESVQINASEIAAMAGLDFDENDLVLEFKSDGKVYAGGAPGPANYTVDGDKLTIITPEETYEMIITKLTSSALVVDMMIDDEDMQGAKGTMYFKRP